METRWYVAPARTKLQRRCPLQSSRWRLSYNKDRLWRTGRREHHRSTWTSLLSLSSHQPEKERTTHLEWVNQHVLLSISVCSNVPEFTEPKCFVSEGNSAETVEACLQYLTEISQAAYFHLERYYLSAFGKINSKIDEDLKEFCDEEKEKKKKGHYLYKLDQKL